MMTKEIYESPDISAITIDAGMSFLVSSPANITDPEREDLPGDFWG